MAVVRESMDVEQRVVEAIDQGAPGGGFILSPCAAPYERPLPEKAAANMVRYLEVAHRYGSRGRPGRP
jgi:hypothetical protein